MKTPSKKKDSSFPVTADPAADALGINRLYAVIAQSVQEHGFRKTAEIWSAASKPGLFPSPPGSVSVLGIRENHSRAALVLGFLHASDGVLGEDFGEVDADGILNQLQRHLVFNANARGVLLIRARLKTPNSRGIRPVGEA